MNFQDKGILVVDDVAEIRMMARGFLNAAGFEDVMEAKDGQHAYDILNERVIDLVICDWEMPNLTGIELFRLMQRNKKLKQIPFLMLTGNNDKEFVIEALKMGINNYVIKPFSSDVLIDKVNKIFQ